MIIAAYYRSEDEGSSSTSSIDLHTVDLESDNFKNLPVKDKYDLLVELKETRKMNSWGKLHTLPKKSDNFSDFQMQRLLKRRKVQECLEETEKEMGEGSMSLNELESLLNEEGIDTKIESLPSRRIASNETTRYLLISNVKQALAEAKKKKENETVKPNIEESSEKANTDIKQTSTKDTELEDDLQKAIKMSLECVEEHDTTASTSKTDDSWTSNLSDSDYFDSEDEDGFVHSDMSTAKAYIMQYSDFTHKAIDDIVIPKQKSKKKFKETNVDEIIEELNKEKSIIEVVELSSEDNITKNIKNIPTISSSKHVKAEYQSEIELISNDIEESIICIDESNDTINLDTSTEDQEVIIEKKSPMITNMQISEEANENKIKTYDTIETLQTKEETTNQDKDRESVFCVKSKNEIIFTEKVEETDQKPIVNNHSESSEDEFEEVAEIEGTFKVPVVQLTLNYNEEIKDDIFADVFEDNLKKDITIIEKEKTLNKINENTNKKLLITCKKTISPENISVQIPERNVTVSPQEVTNEKNTDEKILNNINVTERKNEPNDTISKEKLNSIVSEIEDKEVDLVQEKSRLDRIGRNITEQMTKEAQELLQIFGIPYIIAPMEAEAQCAFLESVKLTDGTITDDSDIWLFGGQTVYKNFFNQKKHVLQYLSEKIEKSFNLTREQLVLLALLVGSDYTTGITGVGPVTALEILATFPFNRKKLITVTSKQAQYQEIINGLIDFKKWVKAGKRTDNISLKKKLKNIKLTDDFPSIRVVQAYMEPNVEKSEEKFTWGNLDVTILRDYTKEKFGWSQNKLDEIIKPVLKRMQDRKNQKTVHDYFKRKTDVQSLEDQMSKRVKAAVKKMGPDGSVPTTGERGENNEIKKIRKRRISATKRTGKTEETVNSEDGNPATKQRKNADNIQSIPKVIKTQDLLDNEQKFHININKTERLQEIIPQREKDKQSMLQNKLKAIETFRKTKIDPKSRGSKRKLPKPKEDAELSESSDSN